MISTRVRVLLVDDHEMVRDGLKHLLDNQADIEVVAEAADGDEALRVALSHALDVVILDVSLRGRDGVAVAEELSARHPDLRIIGLTRYDDAAFVRKMFAAGARGYVLKQSAATELIRAVRTVAGGQQFIDPAIEPPAAASPPSVAPPEVNVRAGDPLTPQEETILRLVASSRSNAEIAQQLAISPAEAVALKSAAMRKAGLLTRIQVIAYAHAQGWANRR